MPLGLKRYQHEEDDHFVTFSCDGREPYLNTPDARDIFLASLEMTRKKYAIEVLGYVVMPEHVHLLLSEPTEKPLSTALQALKLSVSKRSVQRPFWETRYYDFNAFTHNKLIDKLTYMHFNPVVRGLVVSPEEWKWSSYRFYESGTTGPVCISGL
jgi:putative transposase